MRSVACRRPLGISGTAILRENVLSMAAGSVGAWWTGRLSVFWRAQIVGWGLFGLLISGAGFIALLEIAALGLWQLQIQFEVGRLALAVTGSEFARMCAQFLIVAIGVVFVPTLLLGAAFP